MPCTALFFGLGPKYCISSFFVAIGAIFSATDSVCTLQV